MILLSWSRMFKEEASILRSVSLNDSVLLDKLLLMFFRAFKSFFVAVITLVAEELFAIVIESFTRE